MSNSHDNIYNILGKLQALQPTAQETHDAKVQQIRESVEARGSVTSGVKAVEARLAQQFAESEKWIQKTGVEKNKGGLHKALHVAQGEKIPKSKIEKASHSKNAHLRHMAQFAKNVADEGKYDDYDQDVRAIRTDDRIASAKDNMAQRANEPKSLAQKVGRDIGGPLKKLAKGDFKGALGEDPMGDVEGGTVAEVSAPGQEAWIKKNKQNFIDQYGKKKGLEVLYATAWKRSKKDEDIGSFGAGFGTTGGVVGEGNTIDTKGGRIHKGSYGTSYQGDDELEEPTSSDGPRRGRPRKAVTVKPRVDPNAPKKGRGRPKAEPSMGRGADMTSLSRAMGFGSAPKHATKGRVVKGKAMGGSLEEGMSLVGRRLLESVNFKRYMEETHMSLDEMVECLGKDVSMYKQTGVMSDLLRDCLDIHTYAKKQIADETAPLPPASLAPQYPNPEEISPVQKPGVMGAIQRGVGKVADVLAGPNDTELLGHLKRGTQPTIEEIELNELARLAGLPVKEHINAKPDDIEGDEFDFKLDDETDNDEHVAEAEVTVDEPEEGEVVNHPEEEYQSMKASTLNPGEGDSGEKNNFDGPGDNKMKQQPRVPAKPVMSLESYIAAEYESIKKAK